MHKNRHGPTDEVGVFKMDGQVRLKSRIPTLGARRREGRAEGEGWDGWSPKSLRPNPLPLGESQAEMGILGWTVKGGQGG